MDDDALAQIRAMSERIGQLETIIEKLTNERIEEILARADHPETPRTIAAGQRHRAHRPRHLYVVQGIAALAAVGAAAVAQAAAAVRRHAWQTAAAAVVTAMVIGGTGLPQRLAPAPAPGHSAPGHHRLRGPEQLSPRVTIPQPVKERKRRKSRKPRPRPRNRAANTPAPVTTPPPAEDMTDGQPDPTPTATPPGDDQGQDQGGTTPPATPPDDQGQDQDQGGTPPSPGESTPPPAPDDNQAAPAPGLQAVAGGETAVRIPGTLGRQLPGVPFDHRACPPPRYPHPVELGPPGREPVVRERPPEVVRGQQRGTVPFAPAPARVLVGLAAVAAPAHLRVGDSGLDSAAGEHVLDPGQAEMTGVAADGP